MQPLLLLCSNLSATCAFTVGERQGIAVSAKVVNGELSFASSLFFFLLIFSERCTGFFFFFFKLLACSTTRKKERKGFFSTHLRRVRSRVIAVACAAGIRPPTHVNLSETSFTQLALHDVHRRAADLGLFRKGRGERESR